MNHHKKLVFLRLKQRINEANIFDNKFILLQNEFIETDSLEQIKEQIIEQIQFHYKYVKTFGVPVELLGWGFKLCLMYLNFEL